MTEPAVSASEFRVGSVLGRGFSILLKNIVPFGLLAVLVMSPPYIYALAVDPQIVLDHENSVELGTFEAEWGFMIAPSAGMSGYLRPGIGIGADKPYSWNVEAAVKFVWR